MFEQSSYDAVVVGAGPNGLSAAIEIARAGRSVLVVEANESIGGGCRTAELTLPGHLHDVCSAIHPLALASPFFRTLPLEAHGLAWIHPPTPLAHPLDDGSVGLLERSLDETVLAFGDDAGRYRKVIAPLVRNADSLFEELLGPLQLPRHPMSLGRFVLTAARRASTVSKWFDDPKPRALLAGCAAHSMLPMTKFPTGAIGLLIAVTGHAVGWPLARGGSQCIVDALGAHLRSLGGEIVTSAPVRTLDELPRARAYLLNLSPKQVLTITGDRLPKRYRRALGRYRYGPGSFKLDWVLDGPVPWKADECARAGTVHVGGTFEDVCASEQAVAQGRVSERPFVLVAQQSLFDDTRSPEGHEVVWGYCHVPNGSTIDMTERIEAQIERFAPGFRDRIVARHKLFPADLQEHNANYIGGDINGGVQDIRQQFTRPAIRLSPYTTPNEQIYICSASTPPGGGVHGMGGHYAARAALRRVL
jgi:phytoene dehydrogenase-like protein